MHIDAVPNRTSRPTYLLRESYRIGKKVRKRTLANLSGLADEQIEAIPECVNEFGTPGVTRLESTRVWSRVVSFPFSVD